MSKYSALDNLMEGYFNMDAYEITGADTLEGMVDYYLNAVGLDHYLALHADILQFKTDQILDIEKPGTVSITALCQVTFEELYADEWYVGDVSAFFKLLNDRAVAKWPGKVESLEPDEIVMARLMRVRASFVTGSSETTDLAHSNAKLKVASIRPELYRYIIDSITENTHITVAERAELLKALIRPEINNPVADKVGISRTVLTGSSSLTVRAKDVLEKHSIHHEDK